MSERFDHLTNVLLHENVATFEELRPGLDELSDLIPDIREPHRLYAWVILSQRYYVLTTFQAQALQERLSRLAADNPYVRATQALLLDYQLMRGRAYELLLNTNVRWDIELWRLWVWLQYEFNVQDYDAEALAFLDACEDATYTSNINAFMWGRSVSRNFEVRRHLVQALEDELPNLPAWSALRVYNGLSMFHLGESNIDYTIGLSHERIRRMRSFGNPLFLGEALADFGYLELTRGRIKGARQVLKQAMELMDESIVCDARFSINRELARALLLEGSYKEAADFSADLLTKDHMTTLSSMVCIQHVFAIGTWLSGERERGEGLLRSLVGTESYGIRDCLILFALSCARWLANDLVQARTIAQQLGKLANTLLWQHMVWRLRVRLLGESLEPLEPLGFGETPPHILALLDALDKLGGADVEPSRDPLRRTMLGHIVLSILEEQSVTEVLDFNEERRTISWREATISLNRRRSIWDIAVELNLHAPEPVSVHRLFEVGWPNQGHVASDFAQRRVYWAIHELRKLGLKDILVTLTPGYALDISLQPNAGGGQNGLS